MGIYTNNKTKSLMESFFEECSKLSTISNSIVYTEETIPVFRSDNSYLVEYDMLSKLVSSNNYSLIEAVTRLCEENNIDKEELTVVIDPEEISEFEDEDKIEEMVLFFQEAWKNNVNVAAKDDSGKKVELTVNGEKLVIKVKNIDKQIERARKELKKAEDNLAWWNSLSDEEKKSEKTKKMVISIVLLIISFVTAFAPITNPILRMASSMLSIGTSIGNLAQMSNDKSFLLADTDNILTDSGEKIYKNTDDFLKRIIDMNKKIIAALEDYKKKNNIQ